MSTLSKSPVFRRPPLPQSASPARPGGAAGVAKNTDSDEDNRVEIIMPEQYGDRRAEPRINCDDRGALLLLSGYDIVQCRILDQSVSGARVAFDTIARVPPEIWMIDLDSNMAKRGSAAWSTSNRMGLKFNFAMTLVPGAPRPLKVPQPVYDAWLKLSGLAAGPDIDDNNTDVLYFD
jgi:hypothetical protein